MNTSGVENKHLHEEVDEVGNKRWYKEGKLHREDGPAIERADGTKKWYKEGKRHREDGPAIERANGSKEWYKEGKLHRENGPAIGWADGNKGWYLEGEGYTEEKYWELFNKQGKTSNTTEAKKPQPKEESMSIVNQAKKSAHMTKDAFIHGAEVAASVEAQQLLMGQVQKLLGKQFPVGFYKTPLGKALLDTASCYLVHVLAESYPTMPGAPLAAKAAELAMEGVARDSVQPLVSMGKELLSGVAASFAEKGLVSQ